MNYQTFQLKNPNHYHHSNWQRQEEASAHLKQPKRRGAQEPKPTSRTEEQHQQTSRQPTYYCSKWRRKEREGEARAEEEREREAKVEAHTAALETI